MSTPISDSRLTRVLFAGAFGLGVTAIAGACSEEGAGSSPGAGPTASSTATATAALSCAVNGALGFTETCAAERVLVEGDPVLVIRHADGGFRRFDVLPGGTLAETDGALPATVLRTGNTLEVTIGSDRYRLDASLAADAS